MQGKQVRENLPSLFILYLAFLTTSLRYVVRDFQYSSDQVDKEREELQTADTAEKELWVSLPRPAIARQQPTD